METCKTCREYRAGERDDLLIFGMQAHVCEHVPLGVMSGACLCGCASREPGLLDRDKIVYGNAFLGPLGERLDPRHITPA